MGPGGPGTRISSSLRGTGGGDEKPSYLPPHLDQTGPDTPGLQRVSSPEDEAASDPARGPQVHGAGRWGGLEGRRQAGRGPLEGSARLGVRARNQS